MEELVIFKDGTTAYFFNDDTADITFNEDRQCYVLHNGGEFEWHNNCWMEV